MKPDTRSPQPLKDQGQRAAAVPAPAGPPMPASDLEAELLSLAQEEESLNQRKAARREQYWTVSIAAMAATIEKLVGTGFERQAIAKALGLVSPGKAPATPKKGTGPNTHEGWFAFFMGTGVRSYLKAHPDLAATLKSSKVAPADQGSHLPADAFKAIQETARQKAESKCPRSTPVEVSK